MLKENDPKKTLIMKIGVALFALFIIILWILNLKNVWYQDSKMPIVKNQESLTSLKNDLDHALADIQNNFDRNKDKLVLNGKANNDNIHFLQNLAKNIEYNSSLKFTSSTSIKIATTSDPNVFNPTLSISSSSKNITNKLFINKKGPCPEYINCMPTIDGPARSCQIPKGCENVTTLAY